MIKQIFISLIVTLLVSFLFAFGLSKVFGLWQAFSLACIGQYVIFFFYNNYIISRRSVQREELINERLDILSKNVVSFQCPCGKHVFDEVIYINDENVFKCEKCNEQIKVEIGLTPIVKTNPLNVAEAYSKLQQAATDTLTGTSV